MMTDTFSDYMPSLESPARSLFDVTPDDAVDLPIITRALNVAGSGSIRVTTVDGDIATIFVAAGVAFPVRVRRVFTTGTTATGIVGMY